MNKEIKCKSPGSPYDRDVQYLNIEHLSLAPQDGVLQQMENLEALSQYFTLNIIKGQIFDLNYEELYKYLFEKIPSKQDMWRTYRITLYGESDQIPDIM